MNCNHPVLMKRGLRCKSYVLRNGLRTFSKNHEPNKIILFANSLGLGILLQLEKVGDGVMHSVCDFGFSGLWSFLAILEEDYLAFLLSVQIGIF
jgi:hypothetical protein